MCKHSLLYDGRPDWCIEVQVGTWNIDSPSGKEGKFCEEFRRRMMDVYFLLLLLCRHAGELERIGVEESWKEGRVVRHCEVLDGMGEWVGGVAIGWTAY